MRRKTLERLQPQWEEMATATVPVAYPNIGECVVAGPCMPTLMPTHLRFVRLDSERGARPVSRELEAAFESWYRRTVLLDEENDPVATASLMIHDLEPGSSMVAEVVAGSCERRYTHYTGWKPDYSWVGASDWGTRIELPFDDRGLAAYLTSLGELGEWVSTVADPYAAYRSVLVACPEDDLRRGRWCRYADGSRGTPMPIFELGSLDEADELYWTTGASETRGPVLRELETARSHIFALPGGPAGFVQFADAEAVTRSAEFLDVLDENRLKRQRAVLEGEGWTDLAAIERLHARVPALHRFYDRAYRNQFGVAHFGFVDKLPSLPEKVSFGKGKS